MESTFVLTIDLGFKMKESVDGLSYGCGTPPLLSPGLLGCRASAEGHLLSSRAFQQLRFSATSLEGPINNCVFLVGMSKHTDLNIWSQ